MKISICIPVYAETKALFTMSLVALVEQLVQQEVSYNGKSVRPQLLRYMVHGESRIDLARQTLAQEAMKAEPDYLLWLDADQTFPPDTFYRLAAHDTAIVGCNYPRRNLSPLQGSAGMIIDGRIYPLEPKPGGLEAVDVAGFGVMLTKAAVFRRLAPPWFAPDPLGEDGYFCRKARSAGLRPHIDHALSREVGHVAERVLSFGEKAG